jgi:phenylacetate-CoA ligase
MSEGNYFDELETRDPERRERDLFTQLTGLIEHARRYTSAYGRLLAEFESHTVRDRYSLARLPVTRKSELSTWQRDEPPFGGLVASSREGLKKVFCLPGSHL